MSYICITPAKNEEENLPSLARSLLDQSVRPELWVIVNDGSTDGTLEIIESLEEENKWICSVSLEEAPRDVGRRYAEVCNKGFSRAIRLCEEKGLSWDYIGLFDADIVLEADYMENLLFEFERNPRLGLASGMIVTFFDDGRRKVNVQRDDLPEGGCRVWRRECFEDIGSKYPVSYAPDSIAIAKSKLKGWETRWFPHIKAYSPRPVAHAEGHWTEYCGFGRYNYYVDLPFLFALYKAMRYSLERPFYLGAAYLWGYLLSMVRGEEKIDDSEIRRYYRYQRPVEMKRYYLSKIKRFLNR